MRRTGEVRALSDLGEHGDRHPASEYTSCIEVCGGLKLDPSSSASASVVCGEVSQIDPLSTPEPGV